MQRDAPSTLSPDGRWRWDGTRWVAVQTPAGGTATATLSPDGRWRWDGSRWVAVNAGTPAPGAAQAPTPAPVRDPAPTPASSPATLSPDGRWRWDGAQWVPNGQAAAQTLPNLGQAGALTCQVCGAQPAAEVVMRQHVGLILWGIRRTYRVVCCRDCGLAFFRQKQNLTLLTGWWGWISLIFYNPWAIIANLVARSEVMKLPAPVRPAGRAPAAPGRPVYLRAGMILSCVLLLVVVVLIVTIALLPG